MKNNGKGFTLIELLIVVAIIAILAAIAVPNFLEAQVRAKISRAKNDIRTIAVGLEAYCVDANDYPYPISGRRYPNLYGRNHFIDRYIELTTPIAYLTSVDMADTFAPKDVWPGLAVGNGKLPYCCGNYGGFFWEFNNGDDMTVPRKKAYFVTSLGPDRKMSGLAWGVNANGRSGIPFIAEYFGAGLSATTAWDAIYDPTNGTISVGDIGRFGGIRGPN